MSFQWTHTAGVNLQTKSARAVRAWIESYHIWYDYAAGYPGFRAATSDGLYVRKELDDAPVSPKTVGTYVFYLARITTTGYLLTAQFCEDDSGVYDIAPDTPPGTTHGVDPQILTMRRGNHSNDAVYPGTPGVGSTRNAPNTDVFDGWQAINIVSVDNTTRPLGPACGTWWDHRHPGDPAYGYAKKPVKVPDPIIPSSPSPGW